jgi:hypothetical protein
MPEGNYTYAELLEIAEELRKTAEILEESARTLADAGIKHSIYVRHSAGALGSESQVGGAIRLRAFAEDARRKASLEAADLKRRRRGP